MATEEGGVAAALRRIVKRQEGDLALWAFDLLYAGGKDIRYEPCVERKARLASIVTSLGSDKLHHSEAFADGERLLSECAERGLEGIVSKRRNSLYASGKHGRWIKVQCQAWREGNRGRHKFVRTRLAIPRLRLGRTAAALRFILGSNRTCRRCS